LDLKNEENILRENGLIEAIAEVVERKKKM